MTARYEDLAQHPIQGFRQLYTFLGLDFTQEVQEYITARTSEEVQGSEYNLHQWLSHRGGHVSPKSRSNWTQIDKSGTFSDQISEHFGSMSQNVLKSDLKKSQIFPIWGRSKSIWNQV